MTLSKDKFKGYMVYLAPADIKRLQKFAKLSKVSSSQVMRDAIDARLAKENPYIKGFNAGLSKV
jgi:predicted transcriptional regulator